MSAEELTAFGAASLARLLRKGEARPTEVVEAYLRRIERIDPKIHAYVTVDVDGALEAARRLERDPGTRSKSLYGVPVAPKDVIATRGLRTTVGSRIFSDWVPDEDATVVARLRGAGAIVLGKANTHEFAHGGTTQNPWHGETRNPWDPARIPGGSSGGSAAALAAHLAAGSLGTDTGGSIRIPSHCCGTVGLKPTFGRVSRLGVFPLSWNLDHVGPMTRSIEDAAVMLTVIAGHDARDPASRSNSVPDYAAALRRGRIDSESASFPRRSQDATRKCDPCSSRPCRRWRRRVSSSSR